MTISQWNGLLEIQIFNMVNKVRNELKEKKREMEVKNDTFQKKVWNMK